MKDHNGNTIPECLAEYARKLGTTGEHIFFEDPLNLWSPGFEEIYMTRSGFQHLTLNEREVVAFAYQTTIVNRNSLVYTILSPEKFRLLEKILARESTLDDIENFLDITKPPIVMETQISAEQTDGS